MDNPIINKDAFLSGTSWKSFKIENTELADDLTPFIIQKNLKVFDDSYQIKSDCISVEDLICYELHLQERPQKTKKDKGKKRKKEDTQLLLRPFKLKMAVCIEDSIVFFNRALNAKLRKAFAEVFEATQLIPYDLSGSPFYELFLLYRQAANQVNNNNIVANGIILDSKMDILSESNNNVIFDIGCSRRRHPKIRTLTSSIEGILVKTSDEIMENFKLDEVDLGMQGPSIFDMYLQLGEEGYIRQLPDWLTACRRSGKTHRKIQYS